MKVNRFSCSSEFRFPSTRYQGSKAKIVHWIWEIISELNFTTFLDAFGGTGAVSHYLKRQGKQIIFNDLLKFNYYFGTALLENKDTRLDSDELTWLMKKHRGIKYGNFVKENFHNIYFTDDENEWIDNVITNINLLEDRYKFALAFFAMCQACIIKRPYNLFHRKNLYIRQANVSRSFGNKSSWDKGFDHWFRVFAEQANDAVFDNGRENVALNKDAAEISLECDLVYIDTPYISHKGSVVDYLGFYHFLEGLANYGDWHKYIDYQSKHRRFKKRPSKWNNKKLVHQAFHEIFEHFRKSILVVSYRNDGIPSEQELASILKQYKKNVEVYHFGQYKYALSTNANSQEILLVGT